MDISKQKILDALKHVRYPGTGNDIVTANMVQDDFEMQGNALSFSIKFPKQNDPFSKSIIKAAEKAITTYLSDEIEIVGNIRSIAVPVPNLKPKQILPNVKNIIAVFSGKGGVGKSTISSNIAVALGKLGYKVGLLDADIHGPSLPKMFGIENQHPEVKKTEGKDMVIPIKKYGIKLLSIGLFIDPNTPLVWRGGMASNALKQLITDTYWGELDYFLMDLPPGTSDIHLTLVQTMGITGAVAVSTPQEIALADARKGINMFRDEKVNVPILGLIENMAWFTPAELPENKYYLFGKDGGKKLSEELDLPLLGQIPIVQSIREGADEGMPLVLNDKLTSEKYFMNTAVKLVESVKQRNKNQSATKKVEFDKK